MSDLQNPPLEAPSTEGNLQPEIQFSPPPIRVPEENPSWGGVEIIGILLVGFLALIGLIILVIALAHRFLYPNESLRHIAEFHPILSIAAQALDYAVVVGFMVFLVKRKSPTFGQGIRWNWPTYAWAYLIGGLLLCVVVLITQHFLPMPKEVPMDRLFRTAPEAWIVSVFGLLLAPAIEELFFRGFLYPVLARRVGMIASIVMTAALFGAVHAMQLGFAWAPVFLIFLVGLVLTTVRAITKSVAAGWLVHFAYNGTIFLSLIVGTEGFRHLERISQ